MRENPDLECVRCTHTQAKHGRKVANATGETATGCKTCGCNSFTPSPLPPTVRGDAEPDLRK
jgi:predicted  nucleic acid-binding Zn-ribbon protein